MLPTYPVYYDFTTKNKSFIEMNEKLERRGIKNNKFFLILFDLELMTVDPHDPNLSNELKAKIVVEVSKNPWYYFREIVKFGIIGGCTEKVNFILTDNNLAMIWCALNGICPYVRSDHNTFKTRSSNAVLSYFITRSFASGLRINMFSYYKNNVVIDILRDVPSYLKPDGLSISAKPNRFVINKNIVVDYTNINNRPKTIIENIARSDSSVVQLYDDVEYLNDNLDMYIVSNSPIFSRSYLQESNDNIKPVRIFTSTLTSEYIDKNYIPFKTHLYDVEPETIINSMKTFYIPILKIDL